MTTTNYTTETVNALTPSECWARFIGNQSKREWLALYKDSGADLDVESAMLVDLGQNPMTSDLDAETRAAIASKLASYLA